MPARDIYHNCVKNALIKDGWIITHDPLNLKIGAKDLFVDLGVTKILAAEKNSRKIAVEIKSFVSPSEVEDLKNALGQHILYYDILEELEPDRILYMAIRQITFENIFEEPIGQLLLRKQRLKLLIFDQNTQEIDQWID
jgi:hypothetical protein